MWDLNAGDLVAGAIGLLGVVIGGLGLSKAGAANTIAAGSGTAARQAVEKADTANRLAEEANRISIDAVQESKRSADASVRSAEAAEETAALTRNELESSDRARLIIYDPRFNPSQPGQASISFSLRNVGRAAAHEVRVEVEGNLSGSLKRIPRKSKAIFAPSEEERFVFLIQFPSGENDPALDFRVEVTYSDPSMKGGSAALWWSIPSAWERQASLEGLEFQISVNGRVTSTYDWMDWLESAPSPGSPTNS